MYRQLVVFASFASFLKPITMTSTNNLLVCRRSFGRCGARMAGQGCRCFSSASPLSFRGKWAFIATLDTEGGLEGPNSQACPMTAREGGGSPPRDGSRCSEGGRRGGRGGRGGNFQKRQGNMQCQRGNFSSMPERRQCRGENRKTPSSFEENKAFGYDRQFQDRGFGRGQQGYQGGRGRQASSEENEATGYGRQFRDGQQGCQGGRGRQGCQDSQGQGPKHRETIDFLFDNVNSITRSKEEIQDQETNRVIGIETKTTSSDPDVAQAIQRHVQEMKEIKEAGGSVRMWDPLFVKVAEHHADITMDVEEIPGGTRVKQTGATPYAATLVAAHGEVVSKFVSNGSYERPKAHAVPPEFP